MGRQRRPRGQRAPNQHATKKLRRARAQTRLGTEAARMPAPDARQEHPRRASRRLSRLRDLLSRDPGAVFGEPPQVRARTHRDSPELSTRRKLKNQNIGVEQPHLFYTYGSK